MDKMDRLLDKYKAKFGEHFPLMLCRGMDDEEINSLVEECLESGKPYDPKLDPDANY